MLRARVVNEDALAEAARALSLGDVLRVGKGVIKERGTERPSLLADAFEAVVAAVYLDNDFPAAKLFVLEMLGGAITQATATDLLMDAKTRLRQWSELEALGEPHYEVRADGPSHDVTFYATVTVGDIVATGSGRSKKKAELAAAQAAWEEHHA